MAYNPQTDCNHYHVYEAYTVNNRGERYNEVFSPKKVAVICVPDYGPVREIDLIKDALTRQGFKVSWLHAIEDGFIIDDFGDAELYIEL